MNRVHAPPAVLTTTAQRGDLAFSMLGASQFDSLTPMVRAGVDDNDEEEDDSGWDRKTSKTIEEEEMSRTVVPMSRLWIRAT